MPSSRKDATTDLTALILTVQVVPETESQPLQPVKPDRRLGCAVSVTSVLLAYEAEQEEPQLMPAGLEVTVPLPSPVFATDSVKYCTLNVTVTLRAALIDTVQVAPDTVVHPAHPPNSEPAAGAAVNVTVVPLSYDSEQSVPQLMPAGADVTKPAPAPALPTARTNRCTVNVAVTDRAAFIATVQTSPETASHPVHPAKVDEPATAAVSLTEVPVGYGSEQSAPQLMPAGADVTVPEPVPSLFTDSMKVDGSNRAVTDAAADIVTAHEPVPVQPPPVQPANTDPAPDAAVSVTTVPLR